VHPIVEALLFASGEKWTNSKYEYLNPKQYRKSNFKGSKLRMENLELRIEDGKMEKLVDLDNCIFVPLCLCGSVALWLTAI